MLHARVVRPAAMKADLQTVDDGAAKGSRICRDGARMAISSQSSRRPNGRAIQAARALKVTWSDWAGTAGPGASCGNTCARPKSRRKRCCRTRQHRGGDASARTRSCRATYDFAIHTHGSIGPSCAVAEFKDGKLTCWTASQADAHAAPAARADARDEAGRRALHLHRGRRLLRPQRPRGCGRRCRVDRADDSASRCACNGRAPTSTAGTRRGRRRCSTIAAALDASGNVVGWESEVFIPDRPKDIAVTLVAADLADLPREHAHPGNIHQSLAIPYAIPNIKATAHWLADTPFKPSWIRTPGRMQNTFANECFLDELAAAAGVDPLEFRLRNLKDARGAEMLAALCELADVDSARQAGRQVEGDIGMRPRRLLHQVRAGAHVRRRRRGRRGESQDRQGARDQASTSRTTAVRSSIPTACATRSKATSCRR